MHSRFSNLFVFLVEFLRISSIISLEMDFKFLNDNSNIVI